MKKMMFALAFASACFAAEETDPFSITQPPVSLPVSPEQFPSPPIEQPYKSPIFASFLSGLVPGLGHMYLGEMKTATALAGSAGFSTALVLTPEIRQTIPMTGIVAVNTTWYYGIYAAYRDARMYNKNSGYHYKMPSESFEQLAKAPFTWSVLEKPAVWGGVLGCLAAGSLLSYFAYAEPTAASFSQGYEMPPLALPVSIGEEALFRGYLQPLFSELFTPWGGIVASSLLFGAVHIPNALLMEPDQQPLYYTYSVPFITLIGTYCGWMSYKNQSLKECVAFHAWYDFVLFCAEAFAPHQASIPMKRNFALCLEF